MTLQKKSHNNENNYSSVNLIFIDYHRPSFIFLIMCHLMLYYYVIVYKLCCCIETTSIDGIENGVQKIEKVTHEDNTDERGSDDP